MLKLKSTLRHRLIVGFLIYAATMSAHLLVACAAVNEEPCWKNSWSPTAV